MGPGSQGKRISTPLVECRQLDARFRGKEAAKMVPVAVGNFPPEVAGAILTTNSPESLGGDHGASKWPCASGASETSLSPTRAKALISCRA